MKPKRLTSNYALLDVERGGKRLLEYLDADHSRTVPVVIRGRILKQPGRDDGVSIEFEVDVDRVEIPQ